MAKKPKNQNFSDFVSQKGSIVHKMHIRFFSITNASNKLFRIISLHSVQTTCLNLKGLHNSTGLHNF